jgi:hypothetical protein
VQIKQRHILQKEGNSELGTKGKLEISLISRIPFLQIMQKALFWGVGAIRQGLTMYLRLASNL